MKKLNCRELYEMLVRQHCDALYRHAYRLSASAEAADDLVQETYFEAWKHINRLREPLAARSWLVQILRTRYYRWLRECERHRNVLSALCSDDATVQPNSGAVAQGGLDQALRSLNPRYKEAFLLAFLEGWSCREISDHLGIPVGTVLSRIHRAKTFLRSSVLGESDAENCNHVVAMIPRKKVLR